MLPGADVVKIISNAPNLLVYDIETSIPPKLEQLQRILPGIDIVKIVTSSPHLLTFDIENNIAPKMQQLWELLPGTSTLANESYQAPSPSIIDLSLLLFHPRCQRSQDRQCRPESAEL